MITIRKTEGRLHFGALSPSDFFWDEQNGWIGMKVASTTSTDIFINAVALFFEDGSIAGEGHSYPEDYIVWPAFLDPSSAVIFNVNK